MPALRLPKRTSRQFTQPRTTSTQKGESLLRHLQSARHADNPFTASLLEGHRRRSGTESCILAIPKSRRDQLAKTLPKNEEKSGLERKKKSRTRLSFIRPHFVNILRSRYIRIYRKLVQGAELGRQTKENCNQMKIKLKFEKN